MRLVSLCGKPPPPSFIPAMYTSPAFAPVEASPVIWTSRTKVFWVLTITGLCHVTPLSVEELTKMFALAKLKSFQEMYIRPKKGEDGLLSAQPDSRSSEPLL